MSGLFVSVVMTRPSEDLRLLQAFKQVITKHHLEAGAVGDGEVIVYSASIEGRQRKLGSQIVSAAKKEPSTPIKAVGIQPAIVTVNLGVAPANREPLVHERLFPRGGKSRVWINRNSFV